MANNYASYLLGAYKNYEIDIDQLSREIKNFNEVNKKDSLRIDATFSGSGPILNTSGLMNNGNETNPQPVKSPETP